MKILTCKCGNKFEREDVYLNMPRDDPLFRWKCTFCDACVEEKVEAALKRLPMIMEALAHNQPLDSDRESSGVLE